MERRDSIASRREEEARRCVHSTCSAPHTIHTIPAIDIYEWGSRDTKVRTVTKKMIYSNHMKEFKSLNSNQIEKKHFDVDQFYFEGRNSSLEMCRNGAPQTKSFPLSLNILLVFVSRTSHEIKTMSNV